MKKSFAKHLSRTDVGESRTHQAGICVPKKNKELLSFFPKLDPKIKNPDCWITCVDESGESWKIRYVYYNSKPLGLGTRNEYRLTHLTTYLKKAKATSDDVLVFTQSDTSSRYSIRLFRDAKEGLKVSDNEQTYLKNNPQEEKPQKRVVKLRGWRQIH